MIKYRWKKLGVIVAPNPEIYWMATYAGPSFVRTETSEILIYVSGRDVENRSRVGLVKAKIEGERHQLLDVSTTPCLNIGEVGLFDENGASYPHLVKHEQQYLMYYVGWVNGGKSRFQNYTGVAVSGDGLNFQRIKNTPILDRTDLEPFGSGSCCVWHEDGMFHMYYTAFEPWIEIPSKNQPRYNLKYATSANGIDWERTQKVVIDFKDVHEHAISKPSLVIERGVYKLWFCCRGKSYRIGYAESSDGINYTRMDDANILEPSSDDWDNEMQEYPHVFDHKGRRYMIYNGNNFGQSGLGIAILEEGSA